MEDTVAIVNAGSGTGDRLRGITVNESTDVWKSMYVYVRVCMHVFAHKCTFVFTYVYV